MKKEKKRKYITAKINNDVEHYTFLQSKLIQKESISSNQEIIQLSGMKELSAKLININMQSSKIGSNPNIFREKGSTFSKICIG